ncbi:hypothetical protein E2986_12451 [Frieseomelitta varia]|uniref:Large ribosomal subunit protein eL13 n=1 Tax=Frieseomelitta varia TaxID=561572 RepID=A0A833VQ70_9HYME|nr:hypothetical protein E2986_12451 [Frieseomelitta varia]
MKPVKLLRPVVHCPTVRYHTKIKPEKGFSLAELKASGINRRLATTIGIAVDARRCNSSVEAGKEFTLAELKTSGLNKIFAKTIGITVDPRIRNKLKECRSKLILFSTEREKNKAPKKRLYTNVPKNDDTTEEEMKLSMQVKGEIMSVRHEAQVKAKAPVISLEEAKLVAYAILRKSRADARQ